MTLAEAAMRVSEGVSVSHALMKPFKLNDEGAHPPTRMAIITRAIVDEACKAMVSLLPHQPPQSVSVHFIF